MARKQMWGASPMWIAGLAIVFAAGFLLKGQDQWVAMIAASIILALDAGIIRTSEGKRNLVELLLGGAVVLSTLSGLFGSVGKSFSNRHIYLILALAGAVLLMIEAYRREAASSD